MHHWSDLPVAKSRHAVSPNSARARGRRNALDEPTRLEQAVECVSCAGRLDVPAGASVGLVKGVIESVYECIVHDIAALALRR